jgi:lipoprotein-anchoring transpeptidase ErfK/SrfK
MEVLMARSRRTRTSRALITLVVFAIILGSAVQFHRLKKASAAMKPVAVAPVDEALKPLVKDNPKGDDTPILAAFENPFVSPTTRPADGLTPVVWNEPATPTPSLTPMTPVLAPPAPVVKVASASVPEPLPPAPVISSSALLEAKGKTDSGDLLAARKTLNDALSAGNLSAGDMDAIRKQIAQINQTVIFSSKHFPDDPYGGNYTVKPGERLSTIATQHETTWEFLLRLNNMSDPRKLRAGQTLKVVKGPFHVVVTKSKFTMDVYLGSPGESGSMYITSFPVGLGRDDSTPTGTWMVEPHHKIKHPTYYSPRGEGVIAAEDPKNPLGPFWIGLSGTDGHALGRLSYGIHGTIEPDSIGKMASLGCIRMQNADVSIVFELLVEGKSTVLVRD